MKERVIRLRNVQFNVECAIVKSCIPVKFAFLPLLFKDIHVFKIKKEDADFHDTPRDNFCI